MIPKGSRYEYSIIDYVPTEVNGAQKPMVFYKFSQLGQLSYIEHVYIQGERLDQIAQKYYKTPYVWWMIPEFNPEILDFNNIPAGTKLRIANV